MPIESSGVKRCLLPSRVTSKSDTFVVNPVDFGEAEDLKAAGVGQHRAIPAHELMQAAHVPDEIVAGAQIQVIGIRQHQ